jgi:hypothetical protein
MYVNGQPSHGGDRTIFEVMTSTLLKGILGSVASLLAATPYQGNPDRNHNLSRRVSLVELELLTLPEHLNSPPVFSGVRVTQSLVLYVCFVDRCLSFCTFSFGHLCFLLFFDIRFLITPFMVATVQFSK